MMSSILNRGVVAIAQAVRRREISATEVAQAALARIAARNGAINAVTRTLADRALREAAEVDRVIGLGQDPGPLAGVPYGVKDLFDVIGLPTTAGAARLRNAASATSDAAAVARLAAAGAVLVATLNMDEFAYGFVTDNACWGITRNPHDPERFSGGSSGGSAAAVAAGMVAFALGSDTNGSIRIPASLCGLHGIKPTHGSLPMTGTYPFVHSLDDVGAFTRSAVDLAAIDHVLRGNLGYADTSEMRVAMLGGWFRDNLSPEMTEALAGFASGLGDPPTIGLSDVARARSAAYLITAYEGGRLHRETLRADPLSYDPATRDRLLAGAALPTAIYAEALAARDAFARKVDVVLADYDVLVAPCVFGPAPRIDAPFIPVDGAPQPARANLGLYTQPISLIGLPVVAAPLAVPGLPLGVQLIGARGRDRELLAFAVELELRGLTAGRLATPGEIA
jgi:aspartyl-tRNA(Asn)/glutamyl-tRNA(Gln) amidotransferase subunit A